MFKKINWGHLIAGVGIVVSVLISLFGYVIYKLDEVDCKVDSIEKNVAQIEQYLTKDKLLTER